MILYVSAQGVSESGKAYLVCEDFDLRRAKKGRISVESFLTRVRKSPAKTKLIVINAGTIDSDPRLGMVVNDFPRLLGQAVRQTGDPNLWVMCSHANLQRSNDSPAARRNLFGLFVSQALQGAADLNADQTLDVAELNAFVSQNVTSWVSQTTGRLAEQTPQLHWGGTGVPKSTDVPLLSLFDQPEVVPSSPMALVEQKAASEPKVRLASLATRPPTTSSPAKDETPRSNKQSNRDGTSDAQTIAAWGTLFETWRSLETIANSPPPSGLQRGAIEDRPQLWTQLQTELLGLERELRGGEAAGMPNKLDRLTSLLNKFTSHTSSSPLAGSAQRDVFSIALAEQLSILGGQAFDLPIEELENALNQPTRDALDAWFKKEWDPSLEHYYETSVIKQMSAQSGLNWKLLRLASRVILLGERAAAYDAISPGWIRREVNFADQYRFFAERVLFHREGADWEQRARTLFEKSEAIYGDASTKFASLRQFQKLHARLLLQLPSYVQLSRANVNGTLTLPFPVERVESLIDLLAEAQEPLGKPSEESWSVLQRLRPEIESLRLRLESQLGERSLAEWVQQSGTAGLASSVNQLLNTPLLSLQSRAMLEDALPRLDLASARNLQLPSISQSAAIVAASHHDFDHSYWNRLADLARLEAKLIALGTIPGSTAQSTEVVRQSYQALRSLVDQLNRIAATRERPLSAEEEDSRIRLVDSIWSAYGLFGESIAAYYQSLQPPVAPSSSGRLADAAVQSLHMLDPRDAWRFKNESVNKLRKIHCLVSTFAWQSERLDQAAQYQASDAASRWEEASESYRRSQSTLEGAALSSSADQSPRGLLMSVPERVDLQDQRSSTWTLTLENSTKSSRTILLSMDHRDDVVSVALRPLRQDTTSRVETLSFGMTRSILGTQTTEPLTLQAGQTVQYRVDVRRRDNASQSNRITFDVYDATDSNALQRVSRKSPRILVSRTIDIGLPVAELAARVQGSILVSDVDGLDLQLLPNRINSPTFGIVNQSSLPKKVSVMGYALNEALPSWSRLEREEWVLRQTPLVQFELEAPAGGRPLFVPRKSADPKAAPKAKSAKTAPSAPGKDKPKAARKPKAMIDGMLFVLKDLETGRTTFRRVGFAVTRPRSFLMPRVRFDARASRIVVEMSARDPELLPDDAPVKIDCRLGGSPFASIQGKLQGSVSRQSPTTELFVNVPRDSFQTVRLLIDVDGFPRAFRFDVPCGNDTGELEEVNDRVDVQMKTDSRQGFVASMDALPIHVEMDAPPGTFAAPGNELELGLDLNKTGQPSPSSIQRIVTDRDVSVGWLDAKANGTVDLLTSATDFKIQLPTKRMENLAVGVAARLKLQDRVQTIPSLGVYIDASAPVIGPIQLEGPARVLPKQTMRASVFGWDQGSGIRKVEAVLVKEGIEQFPAGTPVIEGVFSKRQWDLAVPVGEAAGTRVLLVRAVDRVGNVSAPIAQRIEVVSANSNGATAQPAPIRLGGQVVYRGRPLAGADVVLSKVPEEGKSDTPPRKTQAGPDGKFQVVGLEPGSYQVSARGVVQNRVRLAKQKLAIKPSDRSPRVKLDLR
ncbi:MAG: hypothetical protein AAFV88_10220 [Planctomycetota bacterium]